MILDWKKVVLIALVLGTFVALTLTGSIPKDAAAAGIAGVLGWLGGLFTPTPKPPVA